ncbi:hypothetical protein [Mesorhizobium hawassense]|nr:hypothetical protein [Mesorhizobium hawassense]
MAVLTRFILESKRCRGEPVGDVDAKSLRCVFGSEAVIGGRTLDAPWF